MTKLTGAELARLSQAVETDEGTGYIYAVAYAVESIIAARLPLIETQLREQIAQDIDSLDLHYTVWEEATVKRDDVARVVRGTTNQGGVAE